MSALDEFECAKRRRKQAIDFKSEVLNQVKGAREVLYKKLNDDNDVI